MSINATFCGTAFGAFLAVFPALATTVEPEHQSPIDIITSDAVLADLDDLIFSYSNAVTLTLVDTGAPDEEATIRADVCPVCGMIHAPGVGSVESTLTIGGISYDLLQFHLHAPAEHEIDGNRADMELHLVHQSLDGALAVVGQIITIGAENEALAPYFDALAAIASGVSDVVIPNFDLSALIPDDLSSYRYTGSLTAPNGTNPEEPFFEPVAWTILAAPITVSEEQYEAFILLFDEDLNDDGFPDGNSREVQPLNGRVVLTDVVPVPLPASGLLFVFALGGLAAIRRRAA